MLTKENTSFKLQRKIDEILISDQLPTVIFLAGIHGNELSGIEALNSVFSTIRKKKLLLTGNLIALRGNLQAISLKERFIDVDLNRAWTNKNLNRLDELQKRLAEAKEIQHLKAEIDHIIEHAKAPVLMVDLHTTSSDSSPFAIFDDTLRNRKIANALPVTKVLGLTEKLKGTILGYYGDKGPVTVVFEAGQHHEISSVERHISAIWLILVAFGLVNKESINYSFHHERLSESCKNAPQIVETILRYPLEKGDVFRMEEGFSNFTRVDKGALLATHNNRKVFSNESCFVFMPLYQNKGNDGYFLVKKISKVWLKISNFLRKIKADRIITIFPGIRKYKQKENTYLVNTGIASFRARDFLHLLGFRQEKQVGRNILFSRRPFDLKGPWD